MGSVREAVAPRWQLLARRRQLLARQRHMIIRRSGGRGSGGSVITKSSRPGRAHAQVDPNLDTGRERDGAHSTNRRSLLAEPARIARAVVERADTVGYAERLLASVDRAIVTTRTYDLQGHEPQRRRRGT